MTHTSERGGAFTSYTDATTAWPAFASPTPKIRMVWIGDVVMGRRYLVEQADGSPDIEIVGTAIDPNLAREAVARLRPDVVTLDLELPRMDGLTVLGRLMRHAPVPVVIMSSATADHAETALRALTLGAVEVVQRPSATSDPRDGWTHLARAVRNAAASRVRREEPLPPFGIAVSRTEPLAPASCRQELFVVGASTGGTRAIEALVARFPKSTPGAVIVQHLPAVLTRAFAAHLDGLSALDVREARDGDVIRRGLALLAPGDQHVTVQRAGGQLVVHLRAGPLVHGHRPSVDVLFHSVARAAGPGAIGTILTGSGVDGAEGLLAMRDAGAHTIAQDERTSTAFGMPRKAILLGAATEVLPLSRIGNAMLHADRSSEPEAVPA